MTAADHGKVRAYRSRDEELFRAAMACARRAGLPFGVAVEAALRAWLPTTPTGRQYRGDLAAIARLPEARARGRIAKFNPS